MDIILNEELYAKHIINNKILGKKPSATLNILARYYREQGYTDDELFDKLGEFLHSCLGSNYNSTKWIECINNQINISKKYILKKINKICVTKAELQTIEDNIKSVRIRRLAFTILVLAKYHNLIFNKNNNWVNETFNTVFKLASINISPDNQPYMLNELLQTGLITTSLRVDSLNYRVNFIDDTSEVAITITDMRELGKEYMLFTGMNYIRCQKCGILFKPKTHNHIYCNKCSKYQPIKNKTIICQDCGVEFEVDSISRIVRCNECYKKERSRINANYRKKTSSF